VRSDWRTRYQCHEILPLILVNNTIEEDTKRFRCRKVLLYNDYAIRERTFSAQVFPFSSQIQPVEALFPRSETAEGGVICVYAIRDDEMSKS